MRQSDLRKVWAGWPGEHQDAQFCQRPRLLQLLQKQALRHSQRDDVFWAPHADGQNNPRTAIAVVGHGAKRDMPPGRRDGGQRPVLDYPGLGASVLLYGVYATGDALGAGADRRVLVIHSKKKNT